MFDRVVCAILSLTYSLYRDSRKLAVMNISGNIPGKFVFKVLSLLELLAFNPIQNLLHLKKFFYENLRNV